jgi:hypothetical protein
VVASIMQMAGYEVTERLEEADAVFLNTCSVRDNAEQKIYHRLEALNALRTRRSSPLPMGEGGGRGLIFPYEKAIHSHFFHIVSGHPSPDKAGSAQSGT